MINDKKRLIKYIIFGIIFVSIIVIGTLYERNSQVRNFFDKYIFLKEKHENNLPKIQIESEKGLNVFGYKNSIIILKNNTLTIYDQNGNIDTTLDIEISNPIFEASGDYLCIAEKDGKKLYVICNKNIIWQKELENNISSVAINSNGYVAISLSGTIYKTIIQAFDNKGVDLFKSFLSSTYVIDMDISQDNKYIAVAEANVSGIMVQSNIKIISIEKAKEGDKDYITYTYASESGDLIVNLKYENKDELACIFDNHIEIIKDNTNNIITTFNESEEETLFVDLNGKIIKIIKRGNQTYLLVVNASGTEKEYEIEEPKDVYISDNMIILNLGSKVLFYNNSGWLVKKYYATQEINKIVVCNGLAGIVYNNKIELVSL